MTAKERLVKLIKDSDIYIPSIDDDVAEDLADVILKEFVRREDVEICECLYKYSTSGVRVNPVCRKCNGLGWIAKGE